MRDRFTDTRYQVWFYARKMWEAGLVFGSSGNVSCRVSDDPSLIAITPSSIPYEEMTAHQIAVVDLMTGKSIHSKDPPSYELPMHRIIYGERPDVSAIMHTHSPFVTTLSVLRRALPPVIDEMMVQFGGPIEVADYAFTGSDALGHNALRALGDRPAALLANHGNVCIGHELAAALHIAITMEAAARVYVQALQIGEPVRLPQSSITDGRAVFESRRSKIAE